MENMLFFLIVTVRGNCQVVLHHEVILWTFVFVTQRSPDAIRSQSRFANRRAASKEVKIRVLMP